MTRGGAGGVGLGIFSVTNILIVMKLLVVFVSSGVWMTTMRCGAGEGAHVSREVVCPAVAHAWLAHEPVDR